MRFKLIRQKDTQPEDHEIPHGESKDIFGIVFTNASTSTLKVKVYQQKVVVISEVVKNEA